MSIDARSRLPATSPYVSMDVEARLAEAYLETAAIQRRQEETREDAELRNLRAHRAEATAQMNESATLGLVAGLAGSGASMAAGCVQVRGVVVGESPSLTSGISDATKGAGEAHRASFGFLAKRADIDAETARTKADGAESAKKGHAKRADDARERAKAAIDHAAELARTRAATNQAVLRG